jgi:hypothetical protein
MIFIICLFYKRFNFNDSVGIVSATRGCCLFLYQNEKAYKASLQQNVSQLHGNGMSSRWHDKSHLWLSKANSKTERN